MNNHKKTIITGSTGLIGSFLLGKLLSKSLDIYCLGRQDNINSDITSINVDLSKNWATKTLPSKINNIIYLAQSEYFRDFPDKANEIFSVNTSSVLHLLEYARKAGVTNFIYASSGGVYSPSNLALSENFPLAPEGKLGFYLSTKFCTETILANYRPFMNIVILRFFFVYGPGQKSHMLIPRLIQKIRNSEPVTLQGKTGIKINPIFVDDAANAIYKAMNIQKSTIINVAGPDILSISEICEIIGSTLKISPLYKQEKVKGNHLIADISNMKELLGSPNTHFNQGLEMTLNSLPR